MVIANMSYSITGDKEAMALVQKMANGAELLDRAFKNTIIKTRHDVVKGSVSQQKDGKGNISPSKTFQYGGQTVTAKNLATGDTAKAWSNYKQLSKSVYEISNNKRAGNDLMVEILDKGTKSDITPKRSKMLYMPLSRKGQMKPYGAKPKDEGLEVYKDFIMIKKAKKREGTNFMTKAIDDGQKYLDSEINKILNGVK
jgi:hypothetical protein